MNFSDMNGNYQKFHFMSIWDFLIVIKTLKWSDDSKIVICGYALNRIFHGKN